jgi:alpha-L-fucosidase
MKLTLSGVVLVSFLCLFGNIKAQDYKPEWASLDKRPIPQWFIDAKFGIFIHWGIYSVPSWAPANADIDVYAKYAEWYWSRICDTIDNQVNQFFKAYHEKMYGKNFKYQDFAEQFKAELFDPDQWADIFKESGAKYVVLTSKHHEGFTLWPSEQSWNWNSVDIGPHRDLCGDLSTSVKAKGLHMGFYYSLYEWFNPIYIKNLDKYVDDHMIPQMKDLVTRYKPEILFMDGEWDYNSDKWKSEQFLAWLYNESPVKESVVVNDRWGRETRSLHGGYFTTEYGLVNDKATSEIVNHPWEENRGVGTSFGYNRVEDLRNYKSSEELVHILIQKVSSGGNLLLDIGPSADGLIPVIFQERLLDIGKWLKINGEAIYETNTWVDRSKNAKDQTLFFTTKGNDLYVICTRWPDKSVIVQGIRNAGEVILLGSTVKVNSKYSDGTLTISIPLINPGNNPCDYAWVFKVGKVL